MQPPSRSRTPLAAAPLLLLALVALLAALPGPAGAANYDPKLRWRTIVTPHFRVHYHQGEELLAFKAARVAEEVHVRLVPELKWEPKGRTDLVILDVTDNSNGFAQTVPYRAITLYATAPLEDSALDNYEDWLWALIVHEYAHILHIDTTLGFNRFLQVVLGRLWVPNGIQPGWLTEGLATYEETVQTGGGRGRSAYTEMLWRAAALEGKWPSISQADGYQGAWPSGQIRYLWGAGLHLYARKIAGEESIAAFSHAHARQVVPFILPAKRAFGRSFPRLWTDWQAEMEELSRAHLATVLAAGTTPSITLTEPPFQGQAPLWTPDGKRLLYVRRDPGGPSRVMAIDPATRREEVFLKRAPRSMAWSKDGRYLTFSEAGSPDRFRSGYDLFRYDSQEKKAKRLTRGARARDAAPDPDGDRVLCVVNEAQQNDLAWWVEKKGVRRITRNRDFTQFSDLVWSPDGRMVALSAWKEGGYRDIHLVDPDALERHGDPGLAVTNDRASDIDPAFSPDGRWLLFASERSGTWNVYAWSTEDGRLLQVTREVNGAFAPSVSPDGEWLAWQGYTAEGWDVRIAPFRPDAFFEPDPLADPAKSMVAPPPRPLPPPPEAEAPLPSRRYNPLPTLFPPRYLSPSFSIYDTGFTVGVSTGGFDVLRQHGYGASVNYRSDSRYVGWSAGYSNNVLWPEWNIGFATYTVSYGSIWVDTPEPEAPGGPGFDGIYRSDDTYFERRDRGYLSMNVPSKNGRHVLYARYVLEFRNPLHEIPDDAHVEYLPNRGSYSGLDFGYTYSNTRSYAYSISPENGRSLSARVEVRSKVLGARSVTPEGDEAPLEQVVLSGEARGYLTLPWKRGHVLAVRAAGGTTLGTQEGQYSFRMGGTFGDSAFISLPDRYYPLRGYPTSSIRGDHMVLFSAEYRLPLFFVERSVSTLPLWLRGASLAVFADAGQAWDSGDNPSLASISSGDARLDEALSGWFSDFRIGVGAEAGVEFAFGWGGFLRLRFGLGVGLTDGALTGLPETLYWQLGSSF